MYLSNPSSSSSFFTLNMLPSRTTKDTLLKWQGRSSIDIYLCWRLPVWKQRGWNFVYGETVLLQSESLQLGALTYLPGNVSHFIVVQVEFCSFQSPDLRGNLSNLVVGEIKDIEVLETTESKRKCGQEIVWQRNVPIMKEIVYLLTLNIESWKSYLRFFSWLMLDGIAWIVLNERLRFSSLDIWPMLSGISGILFLEMFRFFIILKLPRFGGRLVSLLNDKSKFLKFFST